MVHFRHIHEHIAVRSIHADDELLNQIGAARPPEPADDLTALLLAWRRAVDAEPIHELVTHVEAEVAVQFGSRHRDRGTCA